MLIGSPPCTDISALLRLSKTEEEIEQRKEEAGRPHLRKAIQAYWGQLNIGNNFLHEHPKSASSWKDPGTEELMADARVYKVTGPMCVWKMMAEDDNGEVGYVRKETTWTTSSEEIAEVLDTVCPWTHRHVHLIGGRAAACARYPPKLVREVYGR